MNILYQRVAATGGMDARYVEIFKQYFKNINIEVRSWAPRGGKPSHVGYYNGDIILAASNAEKEGFDAMVISCAGDPALLSAKKQTRIPVTALGEAQMKVASTYGNFSVFSPSTKLHHYSRGGSSWDLARRYGLDGYMVSHRGLGVERPHDSDDIAMKDPKKWADLIWEMHRKSLETNGPTQAINAAEQDGAKAIVLGCAFWAGWKKEMKKMEKVSGIPVLDPTLTTVKYAIMLAELRN